TIEAEYAVGEYDIQILSANQSNGLLTFLNQSGYRIPVDAVSVLNDYIRGGMKFFVARVNLARHQAGVAGGQGRYLTPLQISMRSEKFMLPIRLGTVNARGDQELFIFAITRKGRVEGANYATVKIPADVNVPPFTEKLFGRFYQDMFAREKQMTPIPAMFLEYAWDLSWCDPCAANPPSVEDLQSLGVDWLTPQSRPGSSSGGLRPVPIPQPIPQNGVVQPSIVPLPQPLPLPVFPPQPQAIDAFITRLHLRYNKVSFPQDLQFRVTDNRENFQGRFIIQQPYLGEMVCNEAQAYLQQVKAREQNEAIALSRLTGWSIDYIRRQQAVYPGKPMHERR
ncbi:MAG: DUF2330 domain-containing protein, partial [Okeania sp. SIO2C2]|uniref:DUF2330 domain-containing protein n=1 Tax=Okeania sp. SIO2C2 TaxID=2607787 RepID=UPI0013BDAB9B